MKNIYLLAISLLFFSIEMTATPMQTANPNTETTTQQKPTFKERIAHKILKKKFKKIKKQNNTKTNRLAITSLVFGILSMLALSGLSFSLSSAILSILLAPLLGVIAIILGAIALNRMRRNPNQNERKILAIIGLVLGAIGSVVILWGLTLGF